MMAIAATDRKSRLVRFTGGHPLGADGSARCAAERNGRTIADEQTTLADEPTILKSTQYSVSGHDKLIDVVVTRMLLDELGISRARKHSGAYPMARTPRQLQRPQRESQRRCRHSKWLRVVEA
jgi:hypothetical protein